MTRFAALATFLAMLGTGPALATADGPDMFRVAGIADGEVLKLRTAPIASAILLDEIPYDADGLANLGCIGGLSLAEWNAATQAERDEAAQQRWCRVGYDRTIGWVPGQFLAEGAGEDSFDAGGMLGDIAGTEWSLRDINGDPALVPASIQFGADRGVAGDSGCNRFTGKMAGTGEGALFGPMAATRKACPDPEMEAESKMFRMLGAAHEMVAYHLIMALFDENGHVIATFERRDAD